MSLKKGLGASLIAVISDSEKTMPHFAKIKSHKLMIWKVGKGRLIGAVLVVFHIALSAMADIAHMAVAANFVLVANELKEEFEVTHDHQMTLISGSTGKLYAQIINGAPFAIFLSADQRRPQLLVDGNIVRSHQRFTYAVGEPMFCSRQKWPADVQLSDRLIDDSTRHIAIPNPEIAPFGEAAMEILTNLGIKDQISDKLVLAENVGQAFAFVSSGNAQMGLVSGSFAQQNPRLYCRGVLATLHEPLKQDAVLLPAGQKNKAAQAFFAFLQSATARSLIANSGYGVPTQ